MMNQEWRMVESEGTEEIGCLTIPITNPPSLYCEVAMT